MGAAKRPPEEDATPQKTALTKRRRMAEQQLTKEKQRFSFLLCRTHPETYPREREAPGQGHGRRLVVRSTAVPMGDARITGATHEEILDDVIWEDLRIRTASGEFSGGSLELPSESFTDELRPLSRITGARGLRGEEKDKVRKDSVVSRRVATLAACLADAGRPWLAWTRTAARPSGEPTDLSEWAAVKRKGPLEEDPSRGCRAVGNVEPAAPGRERLGPDHPLVVCEMRVRQGQTHPAVTPEKPRPARLIRTEPHKMTLAEGDSDTDGPGEAVPARTAADDPNRPESKKEVRERENAANLGA